MHAGTLTDDEMIAKTRHSDTAEQLTGLFCLIHIYLLLIHQPDTFYFLFVVRACECESLSLEYFFS